ncbi:PREDICTED: uncharacterized protein LOC109592042 [Amphimedon queenslandica]|uniref:Mid2 domain-containing protein n=1 Tax=Amphimedon queenslandica TaxID=400682 RepID=A0A1X7SPT2_AMPQE|nr:PREDICTED: uncharacterized protein LOC109592042 [Amphimedon queenslandica]|eukprot:XP_019863174.1 PREDICTED: uncharacterized protein LOC109592042 [Amphimedon queenslandica]
MIHDLMWSVAVSVSNRFGSDTTDYTNITSNSDDGPVINCQSDLLMSSTILSSQTTSAMSSTVFFMFSTSPLPSLPSLTSQAVATETPTLGTSDPNESSSSQIVGPVVGILVAILLLVAVIMIVIVAVILYKRKRNDDRAVKGKPETNGAQGRNGNRGSNNMGFPDQAHSSTNDTNGESIVNNGY